MCKADSIGIIFKFLHGLNYEYNPIWVQILGKEKLPSLSEHQSPKENPPQRVVMEDTTSTANDQDIPRIPATSFMERKRFLNKLVETKAQLKHGKEEMEHLRAPLNSTSKTLARVP
ncbi:hypothetical protein CR513_19707, partial [Mucuna pruriens]